MTRPDEQAVNPARRLKATPRRTRSPPPLPAGHSEWTGWMLSTGGFRRPGDCGTQREAVLAVQSCPFSLTTHSVRELRSILCRLPVVGPEWTAAGIGITHRRRLGSHRPAQLISPRLPDDHVRVRCDDGRVIDVVVDELVQMRPTPLERLSAIAGEVKRREAELRREGAEVDEFAVLQSLAQEQDEREVETRSIAGPTPEPPTAD